METIVGRLSSSVGCRASTGVRKRRGHAMSKFELTCRGWALEQGEAEFLDVIKLNGKETC
jgi:hypothetical protein